MRDRPDPNRTALVKSRDRLGRGERPDHTDQCADDGDKSHASSFGYGWTVVYCLQEQDWQIPNRGGNLEQRNLLMQAELTSAVAIVQTVS